MARRLVIKGVTNILNMATHVPIVNDKRNAYDDKMIVGNIAR